MGNLIMDIKKSTSKLWVNKKYGKQQYLGTYVYGKVDSDKIERIFVLQGRNKAGKKHNVAFESHEAAKKLGWTKI